MSYQVVLRNPLAAYEVVPPVGLDLRPVEWSDHVELGPDRAMLQATGPNVLVQQGLRWLGFGVVISSPDGETLWGGYVHEVEATVGGVTIRLSLDRVFNRIAVLYTKALPGGNLESGKTAWVEDAASIARYGKRELLLSAGELTNNAANRLRNRYLSQYAHAIPTVEAARSQEPGLRVYCRGDFHRLDAVYYEDPNGYEAHLDGNRATVLIGCRYVGNGIRFEDPNDIKDTNNGFGDLKEGEPFWVKGSAENDGRYSVDNKPNNGHINTAQQSIVDEVPAGSIEITRAELYWAGLVQSFKIEKGSGWTADKVSIRAAAIGNPNDSLWLSILSDSNGAPGATLANTSIQGSAIPKNGAWVEFNFDSPATLVSGNTYWLAVGRTGPDSLGNYYAVDLDIDGTYPRGVLRRSDGVNLIATEGSLQFEIVSLLDTGRQMARILQESGLFSLTGITVHDTGVSTPRYREGDRTALRELQDHLSLGDDNDQRLLVYIFPHVDGSPSIQVISLDQVDDTAFLLGERGELLTANGTARVARGKLVAGRYVTLGGLAANMVSVAAAGPLFIESSQYRSDRDTLSFSTPGAPDPWALAKIAEG